MKRLWMMAGAALLMAACAAQTANPDDPTPCAEDSCKNGRVCHDGVCMDPDDDDVDTGVAEGDTRGEDPSGDDAGEVADTGRADTDGGDTGNEPDTRDPEPDVSDPEWPDDPDVSAYSAVRYEGDVRFIAKPRPPGSAHNRAVREYCATELREAGFDVEVVEYGPGTNVIGTLQGSDPGAPTVVVGAHFDSVRNCDGANDNATGVAALLESARVLGAQEHAGTLIMACWDEEERGKLGSNAHSFQLRGIADVAIVMDMIGYADSRPGTQRVPAGFDDLFPELSRELAERDYRADFAIATANHGAGPAARALEHYGESQGVRIAPLVLEPGVDVSGEIEQLRRSDHASFWDVGIPALLLTDTGNYRGNYYHCSRAEDSIDVVDFPFAGRITRSVIGATAALLESS